MSYTKCRMLILSSDGGENREMYTKSRNSFEVEITKRSDRL